MTTIFLAGYRKVFDAAKIVFRFNDGASHHRMEAISEAAVGYHLEFLKRNSGSAARNFRLGFPADGEALLKSNRPQIPHRISFFSERNSTCRTRTRTGNQDHPQSDFR